MLNGRKFEVVDDEVEVDDEDEVMLRQWMNKSQLGFRVVF